ncbi:MAG: sulfatase-like hydrolase/transferase, partial [Succinivibrionaceae bacterium]|nr:sulfatase-like hydrolase/transferase [Succinivibrionaceae bacterium]
MKKKSRKEAEQNKNPADSSTITAEVPVPERDPEVSSGNLLRQLVLPFYLLEVFAALVIAVILMLTGGSTTKISFTGSADSLNSCSFRAEAQGIRSTRLINLDTDPTAIEITLPVREADTITLTVKSEQSALLRDFRIDGKELSGNEFLSLGDEKITGGIIRADKGSSTVTISGLSIDKGRFTEQTKAVLFLLFVITVITPQVLFIACKAIARRQLFFRLRRYVLLAFSLRSLKIYALVLIPAAALAPHILASSYTLSFDVTADRETTANFTAWYTLHNNDAFSSSKSATRRLDVGNDPVHVSLTLDAPYISRFRFEPGSTARLSMTDLKLDGVPLLTLCDDMVWTDMDRHTCTGTELQTYTTARHGRATIEGVKGLSGHLYGLKLFLYGAFVILLAGYLAFLACRRGTDGTAPDKRLMRDFILDSVLVTISFWAAVEAVFAFRVTSTYQRIADQPGGFMHMSVHQYPVYLIVMLLLLGVYLLRQKVLRLLLILVLAVFSGLVISDFVVMRELNARVIISEILSFTDGLADSSDIVIHFFRKEFGILTLLFAVITVLAVITAVRRGNAAGKTNYRRFRYAVLLTGSALIAAMPLLWLLDSSNSSIFDAKFKSILEVSGAGAKRNYLEPFTKAPGPVPELTVEKGLGAHYNVVFILTESLSSYQSRLFGGLSDGTPRLDKIASESLAFTNHHSNGYNTAVATFTVLTGLPYINSARGYTDKDNLRSTVIRDFRGEGYYTTMMYSSKSIAGIDTLYANAGFNEISSGADPVYRNSRRLTFDSVPD